MVKRAAKYVFVFKTFWYYLQNGTALIMGYLNLARTTNIFHQVALLATMCFCLISTPASNTLYGYTESIIRLDCVMFT